MMGSSSAAFISDVVLPQLDAFESESLFRVVGAFADIEEEAEEYQGAFFNSLMQRPIEGDPAEAAESARFHAVSHYMLLKDTRQGFLNLLAVALFHLHEQHLSELGRRVAQEGGRSPQLDGLTGYDAMKELGLVANAVKHAEGRSAEALRDARPDLFVRPPDVGLRELQGRVTPLRNPLGGADLFVTEKDLVTYADALKELWIDIRARVA
jgi:hypothetical protein